MLSKNLILVAGLVAVGLAGLGSPGCVKVDVNADGLLSKATSGGSSRTEKDHAIKLARAQVREEGLDPNDYYVAAKAEGKAWWVTFDCIEESNARGWPAHFAVRVDEDDKAVIYKER